MNEAEVQREHEEQDVDQSSSPEHGDAATSPEDIPHVPGAEQEVTTSVSPAELPATDAVDPSPEPAQDDAAVVTPPSMPDVHPSPEEQSPDTAAAPPPQVQPVLPQSPPTADSGSSHADAEPEEFDGRAPGILGNPPPFLEQSALMPWGPPITRPLGKGGILFGPPPRVIPPQLPLAGPLRRYPPEQGPQIGLVRPPHDRYPRPSVPPRLDYSPYPNEPVAPPPRAFAPPPSRPAGPHHRPMYVQPQIQFQPPQYQSHTAANVHGLQPDTAHLDAYMPEVSYPQQVMHELVSQEAMPGYSLDDGGHYQGMDSYGSAAGYEQSGEYMDSGAVPLDMHGSFIDQDSLHTYAGPPPGHYGAAIQDTIQYYDPHLSPQSSSLPYEYAEASMGMTSHEPYGTDSYDESHTAPSSLPYLSAGSGHGHYEDQYGSEGYKSGQTYASSVPAVLPEPEPALRAAYTGGVHHNMPYSEEQSRAGNLSSEAGRLLHVDLEREVAKASGLAYHESLAANDENSPSARAGRRRVMDLFEEARRNAAAGKGYNAQHYGDEPPGTGSRPPWSPDHGQAGYYRRRSSDDRYYDRPRSPYQPRQQRGSESKGGAGPDGHHGGGDWYGEEWQEQRYDGGRWERPGGNWKGGGPRRGQRPRYETEKDWRWGGPSHEDDDYGHQRGRGHHDRHGGHQEVSEYEGKRAQGTSGTGGKGTSAANRKRCPQCSRTPCGRGAECTFSGTSHLQQYCHTAYHPRFPCRPNKSSNQRLLYAQ